MATTYKKLDLREQILLRPDTYIGAVVPEPMEMYTWDLISPKFTLQTVNFSRGLMRLFEEIYENAIDQAVRSDSTNRIDIMFNNGYISVKNNTGVENIPIQLNEYGTYIPQMIFCELLTSSNYDDDVKRQVAGRNGFGAKLANIFSKHFIIDIVTNGLYYHQECFDHMSDIRTPVIQNTREKNYTMITFLPDYEYFKINPNDMLPLFYKKCCDISAVLNSKNRRVTDSVTVTVNNTVVPVKKFEQYISFYTDETPVIHIDLNEKVCIAIAKNDDFLSIGFVNGVSCNSGAHVTTIVNSVTESVRKVKKYADIKPAIIKNCMAIFIVATVENPTFTTQTKEVLVTPRMRYTLPETFLKKVNNLIKVSISDQVEMEQRKVLKTINKNVKRSSKIYDIPKLMDAGKAGTSESHLCKLFICEGDSAAGLGRILLSQSFQYNGLFPIRGRLLNVRSASAKQIADNAEVQALMRILGLKIGERANRNNLRYGGLVCLVDSDVFGIGAIQSLIMNFIHCFWPELLQENFFYYFRTPIIKLTLSGNKVKYCYSLPEYTKFLESNPVIKNTKYIKGLGTIEKSLGQEMAKNIPSYLIPFQPIKEEDNESIDRTFNKNRADDRKTWINATKRIQYDAEEEQNLRLTHGLSITEYFNKDVAEFSRYNLEISIPSIMDGFKPSQRKIMYTAFKKNITNHEGIKVAQLGPMVAQMTAYKHGENNLMEAIVNLAQDFTGSNNINWLKPIGQFGSRYNNAAASPRYIYTSLNPITRYIFREEDDPILNYIFDEGEWIEPQFYLPIIPTILVNGAIGLGTGWSTKIPMWNVHDIIDYMKNVITNQPLNRIRYHYNGFTGEIIENEKGFITRGVYEIKSKTAAQTKILITEIPVDMSGEEYKTFLHDLVMKGQLMDVTETDTEKISFIITMMNSSPILNDIVKNLKLEKSFLISNMHLFDYNGLIKKYNNVYEIINEWMTYRFPWYQVRKNNMIDDLSDELAILTNKYRFLKMIMDDELIVYRVPKKQVEQNLIELEFDMVDDSFNYLLNLPITSFTADMLDKLQNNINDLSNKLEIIQNTSEQQMWLNDLNDLENIIKH